MFSAIQYISLILHVLSITFRNYPELVYGKDSVVSVFGPLARCVDDLALWMKTACEERYHVQPDPFHKHV